MMTLPTPPADHVTFKAARDDHPATQSNGIEFRFSRQRPRKKRVLCPVDPHPSTTSTTPHTPLSWQHPIDHYVPQFSSILNLGYLKDMATSLLADPKHRDYMQATYTYGGADHCELPPNAQRFRVRNSVQPGTPAGDAWDELINKQEQRGRIVELPGPSIAGTVISPMGADFKVKEAPNGAKSIKWRPYIDGRATRHEHRNVGAWSHPHNRQYTAENVHDTITAFITNNTACVNVFDYEGFYLTMPRTTDSIARNAIYWQRPGADAPTVIYFLDDLFGHVATPAKVERHADLLQRIQTDHISKAAGHPVHISRRTDDSLVLIGHDETHRAHEYADIFISVCQSAGQPIQRTKVLIGVSAFKFDGYWFDLGHCPENRYNVHPGAVGIDAPRALKIRDQACTAIGSTTRKDVERLVGKLEWVAALTPHIRAMVNTVRRAMYTVKNDNDQVPVNPETRTDLQRLTNHFNRPKMVPFYKLYKLVPPELDMWTDASGNDCFGGHMEGMFWTEPLAPDQVLSAELQAAGPDNERLSLCTCFLELVSLYLMLVTAGRRARDKIIRWTTDAQASVAAWTKQSSKHHATNRLLSLIGDYCTRHAILVEARWWPCNLNHLADSLTHADIARYCRLARVSPREQVRVPRHAVRQLAKIPIP